MSTALQIVQVISPDIHAIMMERSLAFILRTQINSSLACRAKLFLPRQLNQTFCLEGNVNVHHAACILLKVNGTHLNPASEIQL